MRLPAWQSALLPAVAPAFRQCSQAIYRRQGSSTLNRTQPSNGAPRAKRYRAIHATPIPIKAAVDAYREAVRLNPRADGSSNNMGNCLQAHGRFDEAHEAHGAYPRAIHRAR
ncbi:hypothetical protein QFZ99_001663 [Paraburkholderia atlantica]|uniref:Tetratricopeptide repeat protein n=1 Tax=Paraburkholderia atlantica TaxID=2654982 RepID=A0A7W8V660_PARAM|nr:hypothetical protein [Paraburkholderia atlantica]